MIRKIAVCGKGGVGKSTFTALLSDVLSEMGYECLPLPLLSVLPKNKRRLRAAAHARRDHRTGPLAVMDRVGVMLCLQSI